MKGIPTVLITVSPEVSGQMRPPRALYPKGFKIGNSLGRPGMRDLQKQVDQGKVSAAVAQPMLDGAAAILEQIEGSHPKPGAAGPGEEQ